MQPLPLLIISTRLPPEICGVGTFSWLLERHWPGHTSEHRLVVMDGGGAPESSAGAQVSRFGGDWAALARLLAQAGPADILVHYAGRAYHRFGCPTQLAKVLQTWKLRRKAGRLVIFFHELPGRLPVWSKHYWINICQRHVVRQLAKVGDLLITNTEEHVQILKRLADNRAIECMPVPSNIENIGSHSAARDRTHFVVFGLPYGRWQTLLTFDREIRNWQQTGALTALHLIGPTDDKFDRRSETLLKSYSKPEIVIRHGEMDPKPISVLLSHAQFALTTADPSTWSKSTTFMAFLAHGCVPVTKSKYANQPLSFSIRSDEVESASDAELSAKAEAGRGWYEANADWKILAGKISSLIGSLRNGDN